MTGRVRSLGSASFSGNKKRTTFLVQRKNSGGGLYWKKVGYATFRKYVEVDRTSVASVHFIWKRNSAGKRYRYARKIWASDYGEF